MGTSNNPSQFKGNNLPVENMSETDLLSFIEKLNSKTGLTFKVPTSEQWQYAFKGACISKNYSYSGSSNYDDVAWCSGNSNGTTHEVKTKQPNEIGIYDMSGNVYEYVIDGFGYGGSWDHSSSYCNVDDCGFDLYRIGFRLCLDL